MTDLDREIIRTLSALPPDDQSGFTNSQVLALVNNYLTVMDTLIKAHDAITQAAALVVELRTENLLLKQTLCLPAGTH